MADEPNFLSQPEAAEERSWTPLIIGLLLVVAVVAGIALLGRSRRAAEQAPSPYATQLQASDLSMSQANNFAGSTVTYLDFNLRNSGTQTVTGVNAETIFRDDLGQIVQKETLPVKVLQPNPLSGDPDLFDLSKAPIGPGQTKTVRLTLDRVTSAWNQSVPEVRFVGLQLK
jgi:hypothetical protein